MKILLLEIVTKIENLKPTSMSNSHSMNFSFNTTATKQINTVNDNITDDISTLDKSEYMLLEKCHKAEIQTNRSNKQDIASYPWSETRNDSSQSNQRTRDR